MSHVEHQVLLSGGINHVFEESSSVIETMGRSYGLISHFAGHPDQAFELLKTESIKLFTVNALFWEMHGEKYDPHREQWYFAISDQQREILRTFVSSGGRLLGLHTASICFSNCSDWSNYLGGHWQWSTSFHPPPEPLEIMPTAEGERMGLKAFTTIDEQYSSLHRAQDTVPLMTATSRAGVTETVVWCRQEGSFKSAYSALGHDARAMTNQVTSGLLPRLVEWLQQD
jgi:type 1 glutamine amidotransferase